MDGMARNHEQRCIPIFVMDFGLSAYTYKLKTSPATSWQGATEVFVLTRNWLAAVTYGMVAAFVVILASALLLASLLRFTSFAETSGSALPVIVSMVALFIGGTVAGSKMRRKGMLIGAMTGLCYSLFSLLFQYLGLEQAPGIAQYLYFLGNIAAAAVGGTAGVNLFSSRHGR
jgi:putative membrane protein (TIGR04086 family)